MNRFYKRLSVIFVMAFAIMVGCFSNNVFAANDGEFETVNLNNTAENSAKIGDQLLHPEKGWKRYDDTDSKILYNLPSSNPSTGSYYNNTCHVFVDATGDIKVQFKFIGTKIRIIGDLYTIRSSDIKVDIDGEISESFSELYTSYVGCTLNYQKLDLINKEHSVTLTINKNDRFLLDAIDIDDIGTLIEHSSTVSTEIVLNKVTNSLNIGQTYQLVATVIPNNATNKNVTWKSSDSTIATVDSTGKVTAVKEGTATITATTTDESNLSASCVVTVIPKGITPTDPSDNTDNAILTITMTNGNGNAKSYTVPISKVNDFISWYDNRVSGSTGKAYYTFDKIDNLQPFSKKTEYLVFDKISSFEVDEYSK